jgi:hypothetical protein
MGCSRLEICGILGRHPSYLGMKLVSDTASTLATDNATSTWWPASHKAGKTGLSSVGPLFGFLGLTGMPFASVMTTGHNMSLKLSSGIILVTMGALLGSGRRE